jgi:outer membrane receptor protein involved in Fe transport
MQKNLLAAALVFAVAITLGGANPAWASSGTTISGTALDSNTGIPVPNATIILENGVVVVTTTTTDANGAFSFASQRPGGYNVVIRADGFETTRSQTIQVSEGQAQAFVRIAVRRLPAGVSLKTIGVVQARSGALQSTSTITNHLNPQVLQDVGYIRLGDALGTIPMVTAGTSASLGDDLSLSIRGFDSSETATLLDGHPIGPIGASAGAYDYQLGQIWGLSSVDVTYGSGATGLYGANTIAGAVNMQTLNPTPDKHATILQGFGSFNKYMSGISATGTVGKLGYAFATAQQFTDGELGPARIQQTGLTSSAVSNCPNSPLNTIPSVSALDKAACTYLVAGTYVLRNDLAKVVWTMSPKTTLTGTAYVATMWANSTGNGDTDFLTAPYLKYTSTNNLAGGICGPTLATCTPVPNVDQEQLVNGKDVSCKGAQVVANDSTAGYQCMTPQQYGNTFAGPAGGGVGRWHAGRNQDYAARLTQGIGSGTLLVDSYVDNYGFENVKGLQGNWFDDIYLTRGILVSNEYVKANNDFAFGFDSTNQTHRSRAGLVGPDADFLTYGLSTTGYFIRDSYQASNKFTVFADMWLDRSHNTATNQFDPRVSLIFRPTTNDVIRVAAGRSFSEPDPSLFAGIYTWSAPGDAASFNPVCGPGNLGSIGSGPAPGLQPETATDLELALGHRFTSTTSLQADIYDAVEHNPLVSGTFPLSLVPNGQLPTGASNPIPAFLAKYATRCGPATQSVLGFSSTFNAGSATYRGISLDGSLGITRDVSLDANYNVQSAVFNGIPDSILSNNTTLINGQQFPGVPLHTANVGLGYANPRSGFGTRIEGHYIGAPNPFNRGPYWFSTANVYQTFGKLTLNVGVNNVFNSINQPYGYVGLGTFTPENQFGGDRNAFDQASEQYGLAATQVFVTVTARL